MRAKSPPVPTNVKYPTYFNEIATDPMGVACVGDTLVIRLFGGSHMTLHRRYLCAPTAVPVSRELSDCISNEPVCIWRFFAMSGPHLTDGGRAAGSVFGITAMDITHVSV